MRGLCLPTSLPLPQAYLLILCRVWFARVTSSATCVTASVYCGEAASTHHRTHSFGGRCGGCHMKGSQWGRETRPQGTHWLDSDGRALASALPRRPSVTGGQGGLVSFGPICYGSYMRNECPRGRTRLSVPGNRCLRCKPRTPLLAGARGPCGVGLSLRCCRLEAWSPSRFAVGR